MALNSLHDAKGEETLKVEHIYGLFDVIFHPLDFPSIGPLSTFFGMLERFLFVSLSFIKVRLIGAEAIRY